MKNNQLGFSAVEALLIVVITAIIGFTGWYVWQSKNKTNTSLSNAANSQTINQTTTADKKLTATATTAKPKSSSSRKASTSTSGSTTTSSSSAKSTTHASTNPTIAITSPSENAVVGNSFTIACKHTTPNGYVQADGTIHNSDDSIYNGFSQGDERYESCSFPINSSTYPNGAYTITFTIHDKLGKTATDVRHITVHH